LHDRQTDSSIDARDKEHIRNIRLEHPDESVLAEHSISSGYGIQLHDISILSSDSRYMDRIIRD
jgi:hypothetical protein